MACSTRPFPLSTAGAIGNCRSWHRSQYRHRSRGTIQVGTRSLQQVSLSPPTARSSSWESTASAVAQINLVQGKIVNQFSVGGGPGIYNPPYTAAYLAAVPGLPNSVAVATQDNINGSAVAIFDSGVPRSGSSVSGIGEGPLSFGPSASTLYLGSSYVDLLAVGSNGITQSSPLASTSSLTNLQYDNGSLYLSSGQVLNATTAS